MNKPLFTVFTPTFNRAHTLHRVYDSLRVQTFRDFEWVIVDDGSSDHTSELVKRWEREADFPIRYFYQENRGKHVAFNRGVREANGELFLPLDSDDACIPTALERFVYHWENIPLEKRDAFTGVCALCMDQNGKLVGDLFPFNPTDSDSMEIRYRYKVKGEKWGFNRKDILMRFPFPEYEHMKFILEGFVWDYIARVFKTRFINELLRIYYTQDPKGSDQLSRALSNIKDAASEKYAIGASIYYEFLLNNNIRWVQYDVLGFFMYAVNYIRFSLHSRKMLRELIKRIYDPRGRMLFVAAVPLGMLLYLCESKNIFFIHRVFRKGKIMLSTILRKQ